MYNSSSIFAPWINWCRASWIAICLSASNKDSSKWFICCTYTWFDRLQQLPLQLLFPCLLNSLSDLLQVLVSFFLSRDRHFSHVSYFQAMDFDLVRRWNIGKVSSWRLFKEFSRFKCWNTLISQGHATFFFISLYAPHKFAASWVHPAHYWCCYRFILPNLWPMMEMGCS